LQSQIGTLLAGVIFYAAAIIYLVIFLSLSHIKVKKEKTAKTSIFQKG
jgi:hypothetical protein